MKQIEIALRTNAALGECPRWDEKKELLYWIDIDRGQLHRFNPQTQHNETLQFNQKVGCVSLRPYGGFVLAMQNGFYLSSGWHTKLQMIADPELQLADNRFNDGRCDQAGRLITGSHSLSQTAATANLWQLNRQLSPKLIFNDLFTANGIAFSPDNRTLYYADSPRYRIYRCDYDIKTGRVTNRRLFYQLSPSMGYPDGAAVDVNGDYWIALYEGARIIRLNPQGELVETIPCPCYKPTMVAFGDPDLKTLYITSAGASSSDELARYPDSGSLFKLRVDTPGMYEHRFFK